MSNPIYGDSNPLLAVTLTKDDTSALIRAFTKKQLTEYGIAWARANLAAIKKENADAYYSKLGLIQDFVTDLFRAPFGP